MTTSQFLWLLATAIFAAPIVCHAQSETPTRPGQVSYKKTADGGTFFEGNLPILSYQARTKSREGKFARSNYVHPLYDLDGNVLTEDFPQDHLHQRGIFWAWHQVLVGDLAAGDSWLTDDFQWVVKEPAFKDIGHGIAQITSRVDWRSPKITDAAGKLLTIVNETTTILVHPRAGNSRAIDIEIKLLAALPNVRIAGSNDSKGYGGFSVRVFQPSDIEFLTANGIKNPERDAMDCGAWVDINGTFQKGNPKSGIAIFVHPMSAGFPQKWILRSDVKSMQNPVYPGNVLTPISQKQPTVLRYRILIHKNILHTTSLALAYQEFADKDFTSESTTGSKHGNNKNEP